MKKDVLFKDYRILKPKLLSFCSKLIKEKPANRKMIIKILDNLKEWKKKDKYFFDPPHEWCVEHWDKNSISFTNGIFIVEVKLIKKDKIILSSESFYIDSDLRFPVKKSIEYYDDLFFALAQAHHLQEELDSKYF